MQSAHAPARQGTCVVTFDVAGSFQSFRSKGLQVPGRDDPIFARLRQSLLERVVKAFPGITVVPIDKDKLRAEIWHQVNDRIVRDSKRAVLVTCSEMAAQNPKDEGLNLSINRLFDRDGKMLGYGPRPGFDYLDKQFDELVRKIAGRHVILAKEGAFRGDTCRFILKELEKRGVSVVSTIIGFTDIRSKASIEQEFGGELAVIHLYDHLIEWIADRDLIPFMPGCGRVVGEHSTHSFMPVRTADGFSCAYPYVAPFGLTEKWMSLSEPDARELSRAFLDFGIELFGRIGPESTAGELLGDNPRVSMPVIVADHGRIPAKEIKIVEFLQRVRKTLAD